MLRADGRYCSRFAFLTPQRLDSQTLQHDITKPASRCGLLSEIGIIKQLEDDDDIDDVDDDEKNYFDQWRLCALQGTDKNDDNNNNNNKNANK